MGFPPNNLNVSLHSFPTRVVSEENFGVTLTIVNSVGKVFSSSGFFQDFSLSLTFCSLNMICLGVDFFFLFIFLDVV